MSGQRLVILDRDGVINEDSDAYIKGLDEWRPIPGSIEAIARLTQNEFRVAIVSNQSGLARGLLSIDDLNEIHQHLHHLLKQIGGRIDLILFCPHAPGDQCLCRKPSTGLLDELGRRFQMSLQGVPFVGDSWSDVLAARAVGARPILVETGKGRRTLTVHREDLEAVAVFPDLSTAVDKILEAGS
ncbi:D-glycero-beta-D-manno-heptose 1,7-bisphosphate 7-phosphatase [Thioalkalicoccus limnaeus]|uniref:D,D-heptose 1,7-bisphosphate phosphatase n=1 Tax=Thioalkalicoccus limnaeus TaxID=120681 RepID=A0ABV4BG17_9GAMM